MSELVGPAWLKSREKRREDLRYGLTLAVPALGTGAVLSAISGAKLGRNPLFTQERFGQYGVPIRIAKVRTMHETTAEPTRGVDDERVPPGLLRLVRATGADESLQILQVLGGGMSFVGPRPLIPANREIMSKVLGPNRGEAWWNARCLAKPGMVDQFAWEARLLPHPTRGTDGEIILDDVAATHCVAREASDLEYIESASDRYDRALLGRMLWRMGSILREARANPHPEGVVGHITRLREAKAAPATE